MPATASSDGLPHDPKAVREEQQRIDLVARKRADENKAEIDQVAADAFVMGRNMFGPGRGEWDLSWTGWWGDNPPYHAPVFVLTHHSREPLAMEGGTTFTAVLAMVLLRTVPIPARAEPRGADQDHPGGLRLPRLPGRAPAWEVEG